MYQEQAMAAIESMEAEGDMVTVPRTLLVTAAHTIDKKRDGPVTMECLRHYARQPKTVKPASCQHDGATWYDGSGHERCASCRVDI